MGLACAGKTTLSNLFAQRVREAGHPCVVLNSPNTRKVFGTNLGYDLTSRRKQTKRMLGLAEMIAGQDIVTIVSLIHPIEEDRQACRKTIPGYFEVYLKCSLDELMRRDARELYIAALRGKKKNVIGMDLPFEEPKASDLVLESDKLNPSNLVEALWKRTSHLLSAN